MKLLTIVGARPQFIKAATVSRAIALHNQREQGERIEEVLVHTGQHFDANMSSVFFSELSIPQPRHNLGIAGMPHGRMTGRMLEAIEDILMLEKPDWVVVYGDTNSTLAGALASVKLHISVAHVEAGLRSYNPRMPEEVNRIVVDRVSRLLLCPTEQSVRNLAEEGLDRNARRVGDVMYDATIFFRDLAKARYRPQDWNVEEGRYVLCTIHRAENTDEPQKFCEIWQALITVARTTPVVFPVHPRTRSRFASEMANAREAGIHAIEPVSYLEMTRLEMSALAIFTDSGGVQKEAFFHRVPCLTLREETEWVETVESGWNTICGTRTHRILEAWNTVLHSGRPRAEQLYPFGRANAAQKIVQEILSCG